MCRYNFLFIFFCSFSSPLNKFTINQTCFSYSTLCDGNFLNFMRYAIYKFFFYNVINLLFKWEGQKALLKFHLFILRLYF